MGPGLALLLWMGLFSARPGFAQDDAAATGALTPLQLCLVSPLCLPRDKGARVVGASLGLLSTVKGSMGGVELSGIASVTARDVVGVQVVGLVSVTNGDVWGAQAVGLFNYVNQGDVGGLQLALGNYVQGHVTGIQLGGGNIVTGEMRGIQVSLLNVPELGGVKGFEGRRQGACYGACVGVVANYHRRLGGLQAGFINVADEGVGLQLGLANRFDDGAGILVSAWNTATGEFTGVQLGLVNTGHWETYQIGREQIAGQEYEVWRVNRYTGTLRGLQVAAWNRAHAFSGVQLGLLGNRVPAEMRGLQVGAINVSGDVRGVQIGLLNVAKTLKGLQIGGINVASKGALSPVLPLFNVGL